MTSKIFRSIIITSFTTIFVTLVIIIGILYGYFSDIQRQQLKLQLRLAAQGVNDEGVIYLENVSEEDCRFTLISDDGSVLYDTESNPSDMDNHLERSEVKEALKNGEGESSRFSSTLLEKNMYIAQRLDNGSVIRISVTQHSIVLLVLGILQPLVVILIFSVIISIFVAHKMSKRIITPINNLNLDKPLENDTYDEISPLLTRIEQQNREINHQIKKLKKSHDEFSAIIDNMNEGLVMLGKDGHIVAINTAAEKLFNTGKECIGKDFLTVERSVDIDKAIKDAAESGKSEINIKRAGRIYQLNISKIGDQSHKNGIIILSFDISEKVLAEKTRKEFTANVSHELKTPLQTIMGSAELMQSGLAKKEDTNAFLSNIRSESERLVTLIDDIIRLSQLDEQTEFKKEKVDIFETAKEVKNELEPFADKHKIKIELNGESIVTDGVARLVHEIIFNLAENAIKYNKENGNVKIDVKKENGKAAVTVKDNGIGIPHEDLPRIFERFYRVDKSRSKQIGGTGLGLSIVKHAAECLGASITVNSTPNEGTEFKVIFNV
ncbi:MAG: ATP-binding protein [Clostridia bacterium]|nr:ATP-binding protein [Clostridia bacterium]